jgi:hypothetical protein
MVSFLTDSWTDLEKFFGIGGETTANTVGMTPTQSKVATTASTVKNLGLLTTVMGGINSAIGSYYAAQTAQYQAKSQASSLNFQSDMAALNAHQAELSAQSIQEQGKTQVAQYTMKYGQDRAAAVTSMAARGVALGEGSSKEVLASMDLVKDIDVLTINSNATRAAWSERTAATNYSNQSLIDRTSAANANRTAGSISPGLAVGTSLLNSATGVASQWDWRRRLSLSTAGGMN